VTSLERLSARCLTYSVQPHFKTSPVIGKGRRRTERGRIFLARCLWGPLFALPWWPSGAARQIVRPVRVLTRSGRLNPPMEISELRDGYWYPQAWHSDSGRCFASRSDQPEGTSCESHTTLASKLRASQCCSDRDACGFVLVGNWKQPRLSPIVQFAGYTTAIAAHGRTFTRRLTGDVS
jgi:hypothetical protein